MRRKRYGLDAQGKSCPIRRGALDHPPAKLERAAEGSTWQLSREKKGIYHPIHTG